jgi:hypothetical protein
MLHVPPIWYPLIFVWLFKVAYLLR